MPDERIDHAAGTGCVPGAHGEVRGAAHTPVPWRVEGGTRLIWSLTLAEDGVSSTWGKPVAEAQMERGWAIGSDRMADGEPEANAALIVRAVNAHADLVAVVREARGFVKGAVVEWNCSPASAEAHLLARIDAALARAEQP